MMFRRVAFSWAMIAGATFWGCGARSEWKIDVRNESAAPCSVRVELDYVNNSGKGTSDAHANVKAGETLTLISGTLVTTIRSIKVVRGEEEQTLTPAVAIKPGQRYRIVVPAKGPVDASVDRK